jgi:hypothetical protein
MAKEVYSELVRISPSKAEHILQVIRDLQE